jgi:hypothetical protein
VAGRTRLAVYDVTGRLVATLVDGVLAAGSHDAVWEGAGGAGRPAGPGLYFIRIEAGGTGLTRRFVVIR